MRLRSAWAVLIGLLLIPSRVAAGGPDGGMVIGGPLGGSILPAEN